MREVTVTMDEYGDLTFLKGVGTQVFTSLGETRTQRASHVEPDGRVLRALFHFIRALANDDSMAAEWTRQWRCVWRVNTAPVDGPILEGRWTRREDAILAEIEFLNRFFAR